MRKSISAALAALITLSPAFAIEKPHDKADDNKTVHKQGAAAGDPFVSKEDNDGVGVIIIQKDDETLIPNPYSNPEPRMISDAWAIRA